MQDGDRRGKQTGRAFLRTRSARRPAREPLRSHSLPSGLPWSGIALALAIALTSAVSLVELAARAAVVTPRVGDMIVFTPERAELRQAVQLAAGRTGQAECLLDVAAMLESGGSLIAEQRGGGANPLYRVHWSGLRTSGDSRNCGASADLLLRRSDLQILATAVGGFGLPPHRAKPLLAASMDGAGIP